MSNFIFCAGFHIWPNILLNLRDFVIKVTSLHIIIFLKSAATPSKIHIVISFYAKVLKCFPEKNFCRYCGFGFHWSITFSRNFEKNLNKNVNFRKILKIIIINENSFLQIYPKVMSFLTYWFLRIKWLLAKSVEITTETAIYKNRFLQSFKKTLVYSLVIEVVWQKVSFVMICWKQYLINIFHKLQ